MLKSTKILTLIALLSATLTVGKLSLMWLPNIEVVSLLILVYASKLRIREVLAITMVFCVIEALMFGINTWLLSYIIYWNLLGFLAHFATKLKFERVSMALFVAILTTFFGVLTSLIDVGLFTGFFKDFFKRFAILYTAGIWFFVAHIISNTVLVFFAYPTLKKAFNNLYTNYIK